MAASLIIEDDAFDFVQRQAPEPRRLLREGLRRLSREEGEIKALQGDLEGYYRLRVGSYRLIFRYESSPQRIIRCVLIERRALIYQIFADMVRDRLAEKAEAATLKSKPQPVSYRKARPKPKAKTAPRPKPKAPPRKKAAPVATTPPRKPPQRAK